MQPAAEAWPVTAAIVGIGSEIRSVTTDRSLEDISLRRLFVSAALAQARS